MSELVLESAMWQLEMLRARKISVIDLAEAHIRQIERLNPAAECICGFRGGARAVAGARDGCCAERCARVFAWSASDGEVVDCDGWMQMRDRKPEP